MFRTLRVALGVTYNVQDIEGVLHINNCVLLARHTFHLSGTYLVMVIE